MGCAECHPKQMKATQLDSMPVAAKEKTLAMNPCMNYSMPMLFEMGTEVRYLFYE